MHWLRHSILVYSMSTRLMHCKIRQAFSRLREQGLQLRCASSHSHLNSSASGREAQLCCRQTADEQNLNKPSESLACTAVQYLLLTDNLEKVPNTLHCPDGVATDECAPGFFDAAALERDVNSTAGGQGGEPAAYACCPGYFCPPMLTCMMPCPLGAFCPRCGLPCAGVLPAG